MKTKYIFIFTIIILLIAIIIAPNAFAEKSDEEGIIRTYDPLVKKTGCMISFWLGEYQ